MTYRMSTQMGAQSYLIQTRIQSSLPQCGSAGGQTSPHGSPRMMRSRMRMLEPMSTRITNPQSSPWRRRSSMNPVAPWPATSSWQCNQVGISSSSLIRSVLREARSSSLVRGLGLDTLTVILKRSGASWPSLAWEELWLAMSSSMARQRAHQLTEALTGWRAGQTQR